MTKQASIRGLAALIFLLALGSAAAQNTSTANSAPPAGRNIIIFVTDGLRHDAVTAETAPTIYSLRRKGVDFVNSHSLYPTFTTPNASTFATGHLLGDTGDFANTLYAGHTFPNHDHTAAPLTPFIENDSVLAGLNDLFDGDYVQEQTLMDLARGNGYAVATIGKVGPAGIQDIAEIHAAAGIFQPVEGVVVDDSTGPAGVPLAPKIELETKAQGIPAAAPDRSNGQPAGSKGSNGRSSGTLSTNFAQQQYFADMATKAVLPALQKEGRPFFLLYWSRDPDGTQHNQADSLDQLWPGINGPTSRAAIHNADNNLWQIMEYLRTNHVEDNTDIIVVADHGFSTISRREIDRQGRGTRSYSAGRSYAGVKEGYLPPGFLAIDLAHALKKPLYDPDADFFTVNVNTFDTNFYQPVDLCDCPGSKFMQHPVNGNGLIGGSGKVPLFNERPDADLIVAANGGSDLIYFPDDRPERLDSNRKLAAEIVPVLLRQDYVDGVFVDDRLGDIPGTLPLGTIGLIGATRLPRPAMIVNFKSFSRNDEDPLLTRIEISDTTLQEGQGMHGSFSRADTYNNMVAFGPDFKSGYVDQSPVSNADIVVTIASLLKWRMATDHGKLLGRVMREALSGGPEKIDFEKPSPLVSSRPGPDGARTVLLYQKAGEYRYFDQACLVRSGTETQCK